MMIRKTLLLMFIGVTITGATFGQKNYWKKGILKEEFLFDHAPFPSCHAATIAETPRGLVAAFFGGTKERNPDVEIWVCRLADGKWTAPVSVANGIQNDHLRYPTWNPVLYQVPHGELQLYYKVGPSPSTWKGWMIASADGGCSWSKPHALPDSFLGPVKNKPVLLKDGKLFAPSGREGKDRDVHIEQTNDFGKTWSFAGVIPDGISTGALQPTILTYPGHKIQILVRSKDRAIEQSWSYDEGKTWTPLSKTGLPNNNSGIDGVTLKDGRQLLVYNHVLPPEGKAKGARTPLNVAVSKDGITWYAALILEDSPVSQYSYPSVIQSKNGMVQIVYTWRRKKIKYVEVNPARLKLVKIINGQWPALAGYRAPLQEQDPGK